MPYADYDSEFVNLAKQGIRLRRNTFCMRFFTKSINTFVSVYILPPSRPQQYNVISIHNYMIILHCACIELEKLMIISRLFQK
jgi:hypothetical protein